MRGWKLSALVLTLGALALTVPAVACGGSGSRTLKGPDGQVVKVSGNKSLPDSFPRDFPIYGGAKYQGGVESSQRGVSGFYATWTTGDSAEKVSSFYTSKLQDSPWKTTTTINSGGTSFIGVERKNDATQQGFVSIANSGGTTSIGIIIGKNLTTPVAESTSSTSGSADATSTSGGGSLPDAVSLPSDYPKDRVPLPSGARVTSASSISSNGNKLYTVEFYSKDDASTISDYFKNELPKRNWTQTLASETGGEFLLSYSNGSDSSQTATVTISKSDVSGYQQVSLLVSVKGS
ncbi:MAG: hypothetical protein IVW36_08720 [Dehalococcoidia bacterium]|nr:hypothetical protein [Dehalococcoidia bacterium]